jgi:hypothetical protein
MYFGLPSCWAILSLQREALQRHHRGRRFRKSRGQYFGLIQFVDRFFDVDETTALGQEVLYYVAAHHWALAHQFDHFPAEAFHSENGSARYKVEKVGVHRPKCMRFGWPIGHGWDYFGDCAH